MSSHSIGGRTFRVFLSSTFKDLELERNYLRECVFPDLRALCAEHGARFQAIDLRWGVSREASLDQQAMNVCLEEINRCREVTPRPNFLVVLGNRHGWLAPPPQIPAEEFDEILAHVPDSAGRDLLAGPDGWYRRDDNSVKPEYYLRRREGEYAQDEVWGPKETSLHAVLTSGARATAYAADPKYSASATAQEILRGALGVAGLEGHAFCFVRELSNHPDPALAPGGASIRDFVDVDQAPLERLKGALRRELPYAEYAATWDPLTDRPTTTHLEALGRDVRRSLTAAILEEIEHPSVVVGRASLSERSTAEPALDEEGRSHLEFAADRCRTFVGRWDELAATATYLRGDDPRPLVIVGAGGTGKSALMAEASRRARLDQDGRELLCRFVGATAASSDARALLHGLCRELARRAGVDESAVPTAYQDLVQDLRERLKSLGSDRPLLLFLDSLDQLSQNHGARELAWLPTVLPAGVRLVVSTRPGDTLVPLQKRSAPIIELGPLAPGEGADLLDQWLAEDHRTLQPAQRGEVLAAFVASNGNPLYLRLAFQEARRWRSDERPEDRERLAVGLQGIIGSTTFGRLALDENHGDVLVSHALGYLAASRYGLAEDELLDLLSRDSEVYGWFLSSAHAVPADLRERAAQYRAPTTADELTTWLDSVRAGSDGAEQELLAFLEEVLPLRNGPRLPVVLWSRLFFDLRPYLTEREAEGATLITFFHRELEDTARRVFLGKRESDYHAKLAEYFRPESVDAEGPNWAAATVRGLSELPYHLVEARRWDQMHEVLTDFDFLEAKMSRVAVDHRVTSEGPGVVTYSGVRRVLDDYALAIRARSGDEGTDRSSVILTVTDLGEGLEVRCPHCNVIHVFTGTCLPCNAVHDLDRWLGRTIACPNRACQRTLVVNAFTVGAIERQPVGVAPAGAPAPVGGPEMVVARATPGSRGVLEAFAASLEREQHVLSSLPVLCFQQLHNRLQWDGAAVGTLLDAARERHKTRVGSAPWIRTRWPFRESGALRRTVIGFTGFACAVSPDGRRIVAARRDHSLEVMDYATGVEIATMSGHTAAVRGCAITPDGQWVVSASNDGTIKVWDLETGAEISTLTSRGVARAGDDAPLVNGCAVSPDGHRIVSAGGDGMLTVWDLATGVELLTLRGHARAVNSCAVSPDGRHVLSASDDWTLKVWDIETGVDLLTLDDSAPVNACTFGPDGRQAISVSDDELPKVWDLESHRAAATFTGPGHAGWVECCAVTPDGRLAVSGGEDQVLKVWDVVTGATVSTLLGHTDWVRSCAISPDGRQVISASYDGTLKVWDLDAGPDTRTLAGHSRRGRADARVNGCAISPDGRLAVSASSDETLKVWDVETGAEVATLSSSDLYPSAVQSCAFAPDGHRLVSSGLDSLKVWDLVTGTELATLTGHTGWVWRCAVSPDGSHAVSAGSDKTLRVWDLDAATEIATLTGHTEDVHGCAVSPDGRRAVSASADATLKVWNLEAGLELATLTGHSGPVNDCAVSPDGRHVVSASADATLKVWDLEAGTERATLAGHTGGVLKCAVSADGRHVLSAGSDRTLRLWDLLTGAELATLPWTGVASSVVAHPVQPLGVFGDDGGGVMVAEIVGLKPYPLVVTAIEHRGRAVLRCPACRTEHSDVEAWSGCVIECPGGCGAQLRVVSPSALAEGPALHLFAPRPMPGTPLTVVPAHDQGVEALACSFDGTRIASGSDDTTVRVWDAVSGERLATLTGHERGVTAVACSPDGRWIASASWDTTLRLWDALTGHALATLKGHHGGVTAVTFSPDGARIASASADRTVRIWDAVSHKRLATLRGHTYGVNAVAFSPDGTHLVSASGTFSEQHIREEDNALFVWDATTGTRRAALAGHRNVVRAVAFSPDGSRIISGSDDWTIRVWDAGSGAQLADFLGHGGPVRSVAYSPDGTRILSGSADGTVKVWEADTFTESHTFHHPPDGVEIATITGHTAAVTAVVYFPDGKRIASGSLDRTVRTWDAASPASGG